jgi:gliding motility-associated-like protein
MKKIYSVFFFLAFSYFYSQTLSTSLTACYALNGNANDVINSLNGTLSAVTSTVDRFNNPNSAYLFNSTPGSFIALPNSPLLKPSNALSFSAWVKLNSVNQNHYIVFAHNSCASFHEGYTVVAQNIGIGFRLYIVKSSSACSGPTQQHLFSSTTLSANTWYHFGAYIGNDSLKLFINGTPEGMASATGVFDYNPTEGVFLGGSGLSFNLPLSGTLDNIRFYNRKLSDSEFNALYVTDPACTTIPPPVASFSASATQICQGGTITFTDLSTGNPSSWNWQIPGVTSSTLANPTVLFPSPGLYTVSLISSNINGASNTATLSILVNPNPTLIVTTTPSVTCSGNSSTLSANGAMAYNWLPGNVTSSTLIVFNSLSSTIYTVTGTNGVGCSSSATVPLNVVSVPNISVTATPTLICNGNSSTLTASGANSYSWFPGNLSGSSVFVTPGSTATYTVIGTTGTCSNSAFVTVTNTLSATISSSGNLCNNTSINLIAMPNSGSNTFLWNGPGITGGVNTGTISINTGGSYSVVITDTVTGCASTASLNVPANSAPVSLNITPSSTVTCYPGPPVNILISTSANFNWLPASEVTPNTGPLVSVNPSVTSTYTVLATLGSCTGSAAITISINPTPTVIISGASPTICAGITSTLSAIGANDFSWLPGNISGSSVTVSPNSTTIYTVTGANGFCTSTNTVLVTILPLPLLTAFSTPGTICIGQSATLIAAGAQSIFWIKNDLPSPFSPTVSVSPTLTTLYTAFGTNSFGCSSSIALLLNVINSPAITANSTSTLICAGESITLTANGSTSYTWLPINETGSSIVVNPNVTSSYTVTSGNSQCSHATVLILVNNCANTFFGITNYAEIPVVVEGEFYKIRFRVGAINNSNTNLNEIILNTDLKLTFPPPMAFSIVSTPVISSLNSSLTINPFFNGSSDISITMPGASTLLANKRDTLTFTILLNPNGFTGSVYNSVIGFAKDKNNIALTDSSNTGFLWDPDEDGDPTNNNNQTLINIQLIDLFIPNGFSPNTDGINDRFVIRGLNERLVKLSVFNRWGNKVYEKGNYDNSWDGVPNTGGLIPGNDRLPEATYYYILQYLDGAKETLTGFVVLRY